MTLLRARVDEAARQPEVTDVGSTREAMDDSAALGAFASTIEDLEHRLHDAKMKLSAGADGLQQQNKVVEALSERLTDELRRTTAAEARAEEAEARATAAEARATLAEARAGLDAAARAADEADEAHADEPRHACICVTYSTCSARIACIAYITCATYVTGTKILYMTSHACIHTHACIHVCRGAARPDGRAVVDLQARLVELQARLVELQARLAAATAATDAAVLARDAAVSSSNVLSQRVTSLELEVGGWRIARRGNSVTHSL